MAGDWIKFDKTTPDKEEVFDIATELGIDPDAVVGKLLRLWSWFDAHTEDGNASVTVKALLDRNAGVTGFVNAVIKVNWIHEELGRLIITNFDRHNGKTAKTRATTALRVAKSRNSKTKCNAKSNENVTPTPLQKALPEKRREEKRITKSTKSDQIRINFDEFWAVYPRKIGKQKAELAFKSASKKIDQGTLLTALRDHTSSEQWTENNGQFIPHPATWLNGERWNDELKQPAAAKVFTQF